MSDNTSIKRQDSMCVGMAEVKGSAAYASARALTGFITAAELVRLPSWTSLLRLKSATCKEGVEGSRTYCSMKPVHAFAASLPACPLTAQHCIPNIP